LDGVFKSQTGADPMSAVALDQNHRPAPAKPTPWPVVLTRRLAIGVAVTASVLAGMIVFGVSPPPPTMHAVNDVAREAALREPLAPVQRFAARDGAKLAYRAYLPALTAPPAVVAVLIHGSGGSSVNMNVLGRALAAAGTPAYAPDIRGQGQSGRRGDIDYIGQQEDDLADLVALIRKRYPNARLVLAGHSSGGGFALRVAGEPVGRAFSHFVLLAPHLGHNAVSARPGAGGWVRIYGPRIAAISILNHFGINAFNGLPVLAFALPQGAERENLTRFWSYRMTNNFGPHGETDLMPGAYRRDAERAPGPVSLLAGADDESFYADRYAAAFAGVRPPVSVQILPGIGHMGLISDATAVPSVVAAIQKAP
jgi:alpha-beta hydrolase superfamily lysophospholipase